LHDRTHPRNAAFRVADAPPVAGQSEGGDESAADDEVGAGDVPGSVAGQQHCQVGDFLGRDLSPAEFGGIHFEHGDKDARAAGTSVGDNAWAKALTYFNGTAT
jgi:hypothetical protein